MSISVLIVGNNSDKTPYDEVLGKYGINVYTSTYDGAFGELDRDFSLIFFEHEKGKIDGFSFLKRARGKIKEVLLVILTKKPVVREAIAFIKEGAFDYLSKPLDKGKIESFACFLVDRKKKSDEKTKPKSFHPGQGEIIGNSNKIKELIAFCRQIAPAKSTVLIEGETGSGKELFARLIHKESPRANKPLVAVNCAALPEGLLESELFGHQKGAFTGAIERKIGKMELADGGTILFDEIGEMDIRLQAKLLRAVQEREVNPVGGKKPIPVDIRIVATTNRDLKKHIKKGQFREDLYYRLHVIPIKLPPLRERREDIPLLVDYFIEKHCFENDLDKKSISPEATDLLTRQNWPGNIRELENVIERAVIISPSSSVGVEHIFLDADSETEGGEEEITGGSDKTMITAGVKMAEMEKKLIFKTLEEVQNNRQRAAEMLGIHVRTLRNKLNEYKKEGVIS